MRKRIFLWGLFGLGLMFGGIFFAFHENDPVYRGKRLSQHLASLNSGGIGLGIHPTEWGEDILGPHPTHDEIPKEVRDALIQEGTNAIPMLVNMLDRRETKWSEFRSKLLDQLKLTQRFKKKPSESKFGRCLQALAAFQVLGTNAQPALDRILPMLEQSDDNALVAMAAIKLIQPDNENQILSMTNVIAKFQSSTGRHHQWLVRSAMLALGSFGPKASNAIPMLEEQLSSTNMFDQSVAMAALTKIGVPAEEMVPLIIDALPATEPKSISKGHGDQVDFLVSLKWKLWALEQYGSEAQTALPLLSRIEQFETKIADRGVKRAIAAIKGEETIEYW